MSEANHPLTALARASPLAVIVADHNRSVSAWNPAAERLFGWSAAEALGRSVQEFFEDDGRWLDDHSEEATGQPIETRRRTRHGELVAAAIWVAHIDGVDGYTDGILLLAADIEERKRKDDERTARLRQQMARAETIDLRRRLALLAEASAELNVSLEFEATAETAARVGVPELADWCVLELLEGGGMYTAARPEMPAAQRTALEDLWKRCCAAEIATAPAARALSTIGACLLPNLAAEDLGVSQSALRTADLQLLNDLGPLSLIAVPLVARDQTIGVMTFLAVGRPLPFTETDLVLAEALVRRCAVAIENARLFGEAQDALRARDTFLSIASHEIGSPLARVKAYVDVLLMAQSRRELDENLLHRSLLSIERATSRLATITQDLFDVSRLRGGDVQLRRVRLDFGRVVREMVRHFDAGLGDPHRLSVRIARGSYPIEIDPDRIEQVLDNVVGNAMKYSPNGGTVHITLKRDGEGALLRVRDHGIGLPPGAADVIFEPFGRAANARRPGLPGMGLGLYISRNLIERHAGRIWADSPGEGKGTTISVWLPLAARIQPQ